MNIAVVLSGGVGNRIGTEVPKQYLEVNGRPVIEYSLKTIFSCDCINAVIVVADKMWHDLIRECIPSKYYDKFRGFAKPGLNRQLSIYSALISMENWADDSDKVIIHDAARPFVKAETVQTLVSALESADGAIPILPIKDTVYMVNNGAIENLLNRDSVKAGQAPEAFVYDKYLAANKDLLPDRILQINGSTEVAFIAGMNVKCIPGDENNIKITTPEDLERWKNEGI